MIVKVLIASLVMVYSILAKQLKDEITKIKEMIDFIGIKKAYIKKCRL